MEIFVVMDRSMLGRGVFGVFSDHEKAAAFSDDLYRRTNFPSEIRACTLIGELGHLNQIYAAHSYNDFYDTHIFDGIYSEQPLAYDAVGTKGLIIRFVIDLPEMKEIITE